MRTRLALALISLIAASAAFAKQEPLAPLPWTQTRALTRNITALVGEAVTRSSTVEGLLQEIEQSDLIVYLTDSMSEIGGPISYLTFLSTDSTSRYVLIRIDLMRLTPTERIVALAHELQHAIEVAEAPEVSNQDGLSQLYQRIGWESGVGKFESKGAKDMSIRVRSELYKRRS